ncbi:haloalkane dehalogenase [Christiangramia echinicola]|uniref:Haloalkane dehalogenase n=1 Tax=Christiangramia echinicola TaxID=279359 RepID=A0A1H1M1G0_9FLAO|nr:haloalkane dehalogenase [Christiangramia echinicola]SDR80636.1 haloalkane dehalogenase [Christiangramia echinicola]
MEILKTDPARFESILDFPYQENYVDFEEMQMHYIDEGEGEVILALHGEPTWSYLYRKFIPVLKDYRFIAPDMIGFGKSDKIVGWKNYTFDLHFRSLKNFIDKLELNDITLIVQDWGGLLGLSLLGEYPDRFKRVVVLNTFLPKGKKLPWYFRLWQLYAKYHPALSAGRIVKFASFGKISKEVRKAYDSPFPEKKYKDGAKAFPQLVPSKPDAKGVDRMIKARKVLSEWYKPALVIFSDKDPVFSGLENFFHKLIPGTKGDRPIVIQDAGHFLQEEKGEEIAHHVKTFIEGDLVKS